MSFTAIHSHVKMCLFERRVCHVSCILIDCTLGNAIQVRPRVRLGRLTCFGSECDGAMVNGVISFIMSAIVAWACVHEQPSPQHLAHALGQISATYTMHDNNSNRFLQSLLDSRLCALQIALFVILYSWRRNLIDASSIILT